MSETAVQAWLVTDRADLRRAMALLEQRNFVMRLADTAGVPLDKLVRRLSPQYRQRLTCVSERVLRGLLGVALRTLRHGQCPPSRRRHRLAAGAVGFFGGAAGLPGLAVELPITTTLIFRAIADIARAHGEDLRDPATALACMEVFAFNGRRADMDALDSAYFATRVALAEAMQQAMHYVARAGTQVTLGAESPILLRLAAKLAARFGLVVSEKTLAEFLPLLGALGGATLNVLFVKHFQEMAEGHFTVRRLERRYGEAAVRQQYQLAMNSEQRADNGRPGA